jgi:2-polyprenyl-6-methoxyphenol hydroxylase-like FAD-dependent oxidoreductase
MEPVLIAGAGPVGLTTALLLATWRVPTVVFEAAAERAPAGSRAICFQRDVLDIFDRVGCADDMVSEGVTWTTGRTFYREHELFTVTFPDPGQTLPRGVPGGRPPGLAQPPWINLSQDRAESLLHAKAAAEPLIDLRFGHKVAGIASDEDGVVVTAQAEQRQADVHGSHLVGADGARSAVRQLLGIGFPGESYSDQFLICDIQAELPFPNERRFFFDPSWNPGRQVLVHQCPGGVWRIDWQVPAGFDLAAERRGGGLNARVRQITDGIPFQIVWATAYRFHERVAESFGAGRVFLAGDAAHLYAPFGARGLNSGAQDAENLAWKLAFVSHGWSPPGLLDSYHAERAAAAAENLKVTTTTMEFLVPRTDKRRRWRTDVLDRAVADQAARKLIDSGKLAEPFWYTTSPLTTPGPSLAGFPVAPGAVRPPVPGVLCPDGPVSVAGSQSRLRRLFGGGFVILTQRTADATAVAELAAGAIAAPVRGFSLSDIDVTGVLRQSLAATDDSVHLVRPDGHLAAVLPRVDPAAITAALRRAARLDRSLPSSPPGPGR